MKFGIADYGMNVWDGGCFDVGERLASLKEIGYEGLERLRAVSADDAVNKAAVYRRLGMDFATVLGPDKDLSIQWTAAFYREYVWTMVEARDFDTFCRQVNRQIEVCAAWGVKVALHNHLGTPVESQDQVQEFLARCPECGLILDTAHLAAADGDPIAIVRNYPDRLTSIHLKDWLVANPEIGLDQWPQRGRFCELGAGNIGLDNEAVMKALVEVGYDGWIFVEHDTHLRDPLEDLAVSREYLKRAGF